MSAVVEPLGVAQRPRRLTAMQAMRFVAAFMVVAYHAHVFVADIFADRATGGGLGAMGAMTEVGRAGVPIFFVISGFIMLHTSADDFGCEGAASRFARARLVRIYPLYWICLAATLALLPSERGSLAVGAADVLGTVMLWPGDAERTLTVAWTLAYELYFYLLFAVALTMTRAVGLSFLAIVLIGGVAAGQGLGLDAATASGGALFGAELLLFLAGIGIGLAWPARLPIVESFPRGVAATLSVAGVVLLGLPWVLDLPAMPAVALYGPPACLLVAAAALTDRSGPAGSLPRRLVPLGDSSYSLYLSHILVMTLISKTALSSALGPWPYLFVLCVASVAVGHGLHVAVERPLQARLRRSLAA